MGQDKMNLQQEAARIMDELKRAERQVDAENKAKAKQIAKRRQQAEYKKHLKELEL